jgi:hypothetical protein
MPVDEPVEPKLPPPDPHESLGLAPESDLEITDPTVVYAAGAPSDEVDRLSDAILGLRPGALIVLVRD